MSDQLTLGFDTSGPYCGTAVYDGAQVLAAQHIDMHKGQAENLMPLLEETLEEAGKSYSDLTRIGVGTGPGNFTGIRISVAAARGLSLSLGIPAVGVTLFDALGVGVEQPFLASVQAPRDELYVRVHKDGWHDEVVQMALTDIGPPDAGIRLCIGHRSAEIAAHLGLAHAPAAFAPASAIARYAAAQAHLSGLRPAPVYLRPADAAPPRDPAPKILT